jgi:Helicase C-terminal domain/Type III restriction enzyme, res subunit
VADGSLPLAELVAPIALTKFAKLRGAQEEALRVYASNAHADSDIAIELPTGGGKTLIALLILEYWRKQGRRVAILTGNKTLARQLESEARDLGVPTVRFEGRGDQFAQKDLRAYNRGKAIAVMNYWVYINQNPTVEAAEYIVLDDAQLAEGALVSLYTVRIGKEEHGPLFDEAMRLIAQHSESQVADDCVKEIDQGPWGPTDLVTFATQFEMWDEFEALVERMIAAADERDSGWKDLRFRWSRLRARAPRGLVLISADEIVLRPYVFPVQDYEPLAAPLQRMYMSATLHDPEDLRRRLGTPPIHKLNIRPEFSKGEDGRRLFVFNQAASPATRGEPTEEALVPLRELLKTEKKSVWLCSSKGEAAKWTKWIVAELGAATRTLELTSTGDEIEEFCGADEGHLFIAGRFEGMDFADDTCRLAVLPSLPIATGALERFTTEQLKDAQFQRTRMLERIKQAIGRCTRGRDDYAVYYLLDTRFTTEMDSKPFATLLSERTRKQIEVGLELTQDGMGTVVPLASRFLAGDFSDFDSRERKARPPGLLVGATPRPSGSVTAEVNGWRSLFEARDLAKAAEQFEKVRAGLTEAEREHRAFWTYLQASAEFLRYKLDDEEDALSQCVRSLRLAVEEGGSTSWFNRLRKALNKLAGEASPAVPHHDAILDRWDDLAERYPFHKGRFLKWQARLKEFLDGTHAQVCEALETLGAAGGFNTSRPLGDGAPDGVWLAQDYALTIEAKIDLDRDFISLADVNQADGHRRSFEAAHEFKTEQVASVIVTGVGKIDPAAKRAVGSIRVLRLDVIGEFQARLEVIMRNYWKGWTRGEAQKRIALRAAAARSLPPTGWLLRAIQCSTEPFIETSRFFKEWP